jgi:hypothetical protein
MSPQKLFPNPGARVLGAIGIITFDRPDESNDFGMQPPLKILLELKGDLFGFLMPGQPRAHDLFEKLGSVPLSSVRRPLQLGFEPARKSQSGDLQLLHAQNRTAALSR